MNSIRSPRSTNIQRILTALPLLFIVIPFYILKVFSFFKLFISFSPISFVSIYSAVSLSLSLLIVFCCNYFLSILSCKLRFSTVSIYSAVSHHFLLLFVLIIFNNMILLFCFIYNWSKGRRIVRKGKQ